MNAAFYEDLYTLCSTKVVDENHADQILEVLAELITDEMPSLSSESREICCGTFVQSDAYSQELLRSRKRMISWLVETDKLQTQRVLFVGLVALSDSNFIIPHIRDSRSAIMAVVDVIWTYRFTEPEVVKTYMLILFQICVYGELDNACLDAFVSQHFVTYLYRFVMEDSEAREPLMVLVALNDQYMLHDRRDDDNKIFSVLQASPKRFTSIGSSLVMMFNRCGDRDQDLKIFLSKFFYLMFTTPSLRDLLYTNDVHVLGDIVVRELNDLPLEAVDVRAMYLRLLYVMLKYGFKNTGHERFKNTLHKVLHLTLDSTQYLPSHDRDEVRRLTERCLELPLLLQPKQRSRSHSSSSSKSSSKSQPPPPPPPTPPCLEPDQTSDVDEESSDAGTADTESVASFEAFNKPIGVPAMRLESSPRIPGRRRPVPPPPPPAPRNLSVVSVASSDSKFSLETVDHFRPPPPPPPPPSRKRIS